MTWCRFPDGRLAYPFWGRGGCSGKEIFSETDFRLQNGSIVTLEDSEEKDRLPVGSPRVGEWWAQDRCSVHEPFHPCLFEWKGQLKDQDVAKRLNCGCMRPTFDPAFLKGPHGVQG